MQGYHNSINICIAWFIYWANGKASWLKLLLYKESAFHRENQTPHKCYTLLNPST